MTDKEIIKALECCRKDDNNTCYSCPLYKAKYCVAVLQKEILDLINRQQAEIKFAKNINALQMEELQKAQAEIERLEKENTILSRNADTAFQDGLNEAQELYAEEIKSRVKTEAIKEFAERLKEKADYYENGQGWEGDIYYADDVDNIVKEMVGDTE